MEKNETGPVSGGIVHSWGGQTVTPWIAKEGGVVVYACFRRRNSQKAAFPSSKVGHRPHQSGRPGGLRAASLPDVGHSCWFGETWRDGSSMQVLGACSPYEIVNKGTCCACCCCSSREPPIVQTVLIPIPRTVWIVILYVCIGNKSISETLKLLEMDQVHSSAVLRKRKIWRKNTQILIK